MLSRFFSLFILIKLAELRQYPCRGGQIVRVELFGNFLRMGTPMRLNLPRSLLPFFR